MKVVVENYYYYLKRVLPEIVIKQKVSNQPNKDSFAKGSKKIYHWRGRALVAERVGKEDK